MPTPQPIPARSVTDSVIPGGKEVTSNGVVAANSAAAPASGLPPLPEYLAENRQNEIRLAGENRYYPLLGLPTCPICGQKPWLLRREPLGVGDFVYAVICRPVLGAVFDCQKQQRMWHRTTQGAVAAWKLAASLSAQL